MATTNTIAQSERRAHVGLALALTVAFVLASHGSWRNAVLASSNPVSVENALTGTPNWDISGAGEPSIQGFATDISVNKGETAYFKIATNSTAFTIDIYRLGYYQGSGARKIKSLGTFTQQQNWDVIANAPTTCLTSAATGLYDCGNWNVS